MIFSRFPTCFLVSGFASALSLNRLRDLWGKARSRSHLAQLNVEKQSENFRIYIYRRGSLHQILARGHAILVVSRPRVGTHGGHELWTNVRWN